MSFSLTLLIRKTIFDERRIPSGRLLSKIKLFAETLESPTADIEVMKGIGHDALINRTESAFVKFLVSNYGPGKYSIIRVDGKFKSFFNAYIDKDRWIREKGSISPYLKSLQIRQWHAF